MFVSGDIYRWDITLIIKVLLFTKKSKTKFSTDSEFLGQEEALKSLRKIKNNFISHAPSLELTEKEYEVTTKDMKEALGTIGLSEEDFNNALAGIIIFSLCFRIAVCEFFFKYLNQIIFLLALAQQIYIIVLFPIIK